ncbi:MAG TPA: hypothetical protein VKY31_15525, partial [Terriglobia bacterium]|nr:hypothetical protein [Terriglobia bacterium]
VRAGEQLGGELRGIHDTERIGFYHYGDAGEFDGRVPTRSRQRHPDRASITGADWQKALSTEVATDLPANGFSVETFALGNHPIASSG